MINLKAIILTALSEEYQAVRLHLTDLKEEVHKNYTVYEHGVFHTEVGTWHVLIAQIGAGNAGAALEAERAISQFQPSVALFVGVAGSIKDASLGDVVASTKIYNYEAGAGRTKFQPRPDVGEAAYKLVQRARAEANRPDWKARILPGSQRSPKAIVAPIAAGEKVVKATKSATYQFIRASYGDAVAVEMEGRGFLQAVHANAIDGMVIRGISDTVDDKEQVDAEGWQPIAAQHAAAFAFEVLAKLEVAPFQGKTLTMTADRWKMLIQLAPGLYPRGPEERNIWVRAGGDLAALTLGTDGKTIWYSAMRLLERGGGGPTISIEQLVEAMLEDFPGNGDLLQVVGIV